LDEKYEMNGYITRFTGWEMIIDVISIQTGANNGGIPIYETIYLDANLDIGALNKYVNN